jgi:hypothetical protein
MFLLNIISRDVIKGGIGFFGDFDFITPNFRIERIYIMGIIKIHCKKYICVDSKIVENGPL